MSETPVLESDGLDSEQTISDAIAEISVPTDKPSGPACKKCQHPFDAGAVTVCQKCGYYELSDSYIEVEPWQEEGEEEEQVEKGPPSHVEVWVDLIANLTNRMPMWAWILIAALAAIVAESFLAKAVTPVGSTSRAFWSIGQLAIGFFVVVICHLTVYFATIMESDQFGIFDIILKPLAIWSPTIKRLPKTQMKVIVAPSGLMAMLMSVMVIGGLEYEKLMDWGFEPPPKQNLMKAIIAQANKVKAKEQPLDEAIEDFAGAEVEEEAQEKVIEKKNDRQAVECVIVGYQTSRNNTRRLRSLILAAEIKGQLSIIGSVSEGISDVVREKLMKKLTKIARATPFLSTSQSGHWVEPQLTCRVLCKNQSKGGRLVAPVFDKLLNEFNFSF